MSKPRRISNNMPITSAYIPLQDITKLTSLLAIDFSLNPVSGTNLSERGFGRKPSHLYIIVHSYKFDVAVTLFGNKAAERGPSTVLATPVIRYRGTEISIQSKVLHTRIHLHRRFPTQRILFKELWQAELSTFSYSCKTYTTTHKKQYSQQEFAVVLYMR